MRKHFSQVRVLRTRLISFGLSHMLLVLASCGVTDANVKIAPKIEKNSHNASTNSTAPIATAPTAAAQTEIIDETPSQITDNPPMISEHSTTVPDARESHDLESAEEENAVSSITSTSSASLLFTRMKLATQNRVMLGQYFFSDTGVIDHNNSASFSPWTSSLSELSLRSDIFSLCGKHPKVYGFNVNPYLDGNRPIDFLLNMDARNVILFAEWSPGNFVTGASRHCPSTPDCVPRNIARVLPGGDKHHILLRELDSLASFFHSLRRTNGDQIPLVFKPFKQMNGDWWWWGIGSLQSQVDNTPDEIKSIFSFSVNYLREVKKVENILVSYSPNFKNNMSQSDYLEHYPGDHVVDILGIDAYSPTLNEKLSSMDFLPVLAQTKTKITAITEFGFDPKKGIGFAGHNQANTAPQWWSYTMHRIHTLDFALAILGPNRHDRFFVPVEPLARENFKSTVCDSEDVMLLP